MASVLIVVFGIDRKQAIANLGLSLRDTTPIITVYTRPFKRVDAEIYKPFDLLILDFYHAYQHGRKPATERETDRVVSDWLASCIRPHSSKHSNVILVPPMAGSGVDSGLRRTEYWLHSFNQQLEVQNIDKQSIKALSPEILIDTVHSLIGARNPNRAFGKTVKSGIAQLFNPPK